MSGFTKSRQHEKLRGHQRTSGDDDLAIGVDSVVLTGLVAIGHTNCRAILDLDAAHPRMQLDLQLWIAFQRGNEGICRTAALAVAVHELKEADTALAGAIEVMVEGQAQCLNTLHEPARHLVDVDLAREQVDRNENKDRCC